MFYRQAPLGVPSTGFVQGAHLSPASEQVPRPMMPPYGVASTMQAGTHTPGALFARGTFTVHAGNL